MSDEEGEREVVRSPAEEGQRRYDDLTYSGRSERSGGPVRGCDCCWSLSGVIDPLYWLSVSLILNCCGKQAKRVKNW